MAKNVDLKWQQIELLDVDAQAILGLDQEGRIWFGTWDWEGDKPELTWMRIAQSVSA